ncbi:Protein of unknown function [Cotesia congregata]|uniref:PHD-type domain-containing protein n=1 Tax=Cotesia congregata TaxID=51543 RepID=A0A8J2MNB9_COTCN|nr:Protein of unknown function [Cotesia congregata]
MSHWVNSKMAPNRYTCLACNRQIRVDAGCIGCCECKKWFHKSCSGLSVSEFKKWFHKSCSSLSVSVFKKYYADFKKTNKTSWKCSRCSFEVSIVDSGDEIDDTDDESPLSIKQIEQMFIKYITPFKEKIDKLEDSVIGLHADLKKFTEQNNKLTQQQKSLEKKITDIEKQLVSVKSGSADQNEIISELNERKKRESEVIIINVLESKKPPGVDRRQEDVEIIKTLIPPDISNLLPDIKLRRLGKPTQGKTRPVLLYTPSSKVARAIIKSKPATETNIKFKFSLTQAQQQHLSTLRAELDELAENEDINETIKYINGVPKIQHGFVSGHSTATNLYLYTGHVLDAMNEGLTTHTIYTDFSKAFDMAIYYLNNHLLTEGSFVKDLSIIVDSKLNFVKHVDKITSQVYKILGFIIRSGKEFKDPNTLIHLFKTLVHPILEYCSIISSPHTQGLVDEVEKIQRKFCKFVSYFMYTKDVHLSTEEVYNQFKLDSLKNRRIVADLTFFYKAINGEIQSPEIRNQYELIELRSGLRSTRLLSSTKTSKNYVYHGPKNRISNLVNKYSSDIDFFMDSISSFTSKVKNSISTS